MTDQLTHITPHGMSGDEIVRFLAELNKTLELLVKMQPLVVCDDEGDAHRQNAECRVLDAIATLCTFQMQLEVKGEAS